MPELQSLNSSSQRHVFLQIEKAAQKQGCFPWKKKQKNLEWQRIFSMTQQKQD